MPFAFLSPASAVYLGVPARLVFLLIPLAGAAVFIHMMIRRVRPLLAAAPDPRFGDVPARLWLVLKLWLAQWRQPRYFVAGALHILLFFAFLVLGLRSTQLVFLGFMETFTLPGFGGELGACYNVAKDYAATVCLLSVVLLAWRRGVVKPERYKVPAALGKDHTGEALLVLGLIGTLLVSESLFEACGLAAAPGEGAWAGTLAWAFRHLLAGCPGGFLGHLGVAAYAVHDLTFFYFLCLLPRGKHFHVITSLFNVFFMRLEPGHVKPVRHDVRDADLDKLETFGVKKLEDFTWKHLLDFYSCADCGRCSDQCPANRVKRPLSPRFITIKGRGHLFERYPLAGPQATGPAPLVGGIYSEDEIWSCTTCGACEEECPIGIEYIDKIVDLRRGLVEEGRVPPSLQKPLSSIEKRGNPWGKLEKKRADWIAGVGDGLKVKTADAGDAAPDLYFVDSMTSYDDRMQKIAQATARILGRAGVDFLILGKAEKDSGHEVRRYGEEMLFQSLRDENTQAILDCAPSRIVASDPHAYNALKHDYELGVPVTHVSELIQAGLRSGKLRPKPVADPTRVYTYHDPCYLGRHNGLYEAPREAIDAIPGLKRVEMAGACRDRSLCCGGGGLNLFYEPEEAQRMGVLRVAQAAQAGANVIVTACPFCLTNMEDAIKVAGLEGRMEAVDLCELVDGHLQA